MPERIVSVFGTGRAEDGEPVFEIAWELGRILAKAGFVVANGGYGGTMLATARGATGAGGTVIGVTCKAFKNSVANECVTREIVTESLEERLHNLVEMADAYVVLPGGTGTLLELASVWELSALLGRKSGPEAFWSDRRARAFIREKMSAWDGISPCLPRSTGSLSTRERVATRRV